MNKKGIQLQCTTVLYVCDDLGKKAIGTVDRARESVVTVQLAIQPTTSLDT